MPLRRNGSSQASTQGSTTQGDEEQRFAELLKPIKDLTANWNVPLAEYLETYYEELTELHIDIDGQTAKVNFAEAALLLQGTAAVYSRKVEFLWKTVEKMLDLLASKKALDDGPGNPTVQGGRRAKKAFILDPSSFSSIDLSIELAKNVDMKPELLAMSQLKGTSSVGTPEHHQRKMTLKFIFVTPRQLIERGTEGKEMKEIRVNLYVPPAGNSTSSTKYDLIGHKEDFRVNMQFALGTAMIGEELSHQSDLGQQSVSLCEDDSILDDSMSVSLFEPPDPSNQNGPEFQLPNQANSPGPSSSADSCQNENATSDNASSAPSIESQSVTSDQDFDCESNNDDEDVNSNGNNIDPGTEIPGGLEGVAGSSSSENVNCDGVKTRIRNSRSSKAQAEPEQMAPLADPWEPITPHEAANTIPKPIRRGRIRRAPTQNIQLAGTKSRPKKQSPNINGLQTIVPVEDFMIQQLSGGKYSLKLRVGNKDTGMAAELQDRADTVEKEKKRKAVLQNKQNNNIPAVANMELIPDLEENEEDAQNINDVDDGWTDADFENDVMPDPHEGGVAALVPEELIMQGSGETRNSGDYAEPSSEHGVDSYEELVMKRVAAYVAQSQDYIESTDLAKRVAKWHDSIGPRLDAVERRGHFDIHQYGSEILEHFPEGKAKTTITFNELAQGKEKEEVARYFLSSLMLANTYNIGIKNSTEEALVMDKVEMTLLSTKRHHENMFQDSDTGEQKNASPKRKGRQRKSLASNASFASDDDTNSNSSPLFDKSVRISSEKTKGGKSKGTKRKNNLVNGHLHPIEEESSSQNGICSEQMSTHHSVRKSVQPCSVNLERLDNPQVQSVQTSPENITSVLNNSEPLFHPFQKGLNNTLGVATFKVPLPTAEEPNKGKKRKMR